MYVQYSAAEMDDPDDKLLILNTDNDNYVISDEEMESNTLDRYQWSGLVE